MYKAGYEVETNEESKGFFFGARIEHTEDGSFDWIGNLYVIANCESEAISKFEHYLNRHAIRWNIDTSPQRIDSIEHALDLIAIAERNDIINVKNGSVIQGWGL